MGADTGVVSVALGVVTSIVAMVPGVDTGVLSMTLGVVTRVVAVIVLCL